MAKSSALPTGVWGMIGRSFKVVFANLGLFFGATIVFLVLMGFAEWLFGYFLYNFGDTFAAKTAIGVLYFVLTMFLGILLGVTTAFISSNTLNGKKVEVQGAVKFTFGKIWTAVGVALRTLWYVFRLPLIVILIGVVYVFVLKFFGVDISLSSFNPKTIVASPNLAVLFTTWIVFAAATIFIFYWMIFRSVKSVFSYFTFVEDGYEKWDAVNKSVKTVGNLWWGTFGDYLAGSLFLAIVFMIPTIFLMRLIGLNEGEPVFILINLISTGLISFLVSVFLNLTYRKYKGYNG
ncbi:MAG: hypothetical protein WC873_02990 [Candidatus Gracilibacteria bacterium]